MLVERPWPISIATAFSLGLIYAVILLGPKTAFGIAPFWDMPNLNAAGFLDIEMHSPVIGDFAQDPRRWPLLARM
jgi:hypothetical protein